MHTQDAAKHTLDLLWETFSSLFAKFKIDWDDPAVVASPPDGATERDMRVSLWQCRLGYILSSWVIWEHYARQMCERLPIRFAKKQSESFPQWVERSFTANGLNFGDAEWFTNANAMRNLIVHHGAMVKATNGKAADLAEQAYKAFPMMEKSLEGYLMPSDQDVLAVSWNIPNFVEQNPLPPPAIQS